MKLAELQDDNIETRKLKTEKLLKNWKEINTTLYY